MKDNYSKIITKTNDFPVSNQVDKELNDEGGDNDDKNKLSVEKEEPSSQVVTLLTLGETILSCMQQQQFFWNFLSSPPH